MNTYQIFVEAQRLPHSREIQLFPERSIQSLHGVLVNNIHPAVNRT